MQRSDFMSPAQDDVLITEELARRPSRPPDFEAEARALTALAQAMSADPGAILHRLVDAVRDLCHAGSAAVSLLEPGGEHDVLRWHAVAGLFSPPLDGTISREVSACSVVLDRNAVLLFDRPQRRFADIPSTEPPVHEVLIAPFHLGGRPVGAVWALSHTPSRQFDGEDARLLQSLSQFAAAAWQMVTALDAATAKVAALRSQAVDAASREGHRPLSELWELIAQRMGVCPSFFRMAQDAPPLAWGLFRLAEFAYLDAPMPSLFKETLFTYLSRFCEVRYCVARHCAFLLGQGFVAGDPACPPLSAEEALALLQEPPPPEVELPTWLRGLEEVAAPLAHWPDPSSELGRGFRVACAVIFIDPHGQEAWVRALRRLLGPARHERLMLFLSFIRTAHFWTEVHPELTLEPDAVELFQGHQRLAQLLLNEKDAPRWRLREALRVSDTRLRLALSAARMGTWTWDVAADEHRRDGNLNALLGLPAQETVLPFADFLDHMHPNDRAAVWTAFDQSARQGRPLNVEFQVIRPDGAVRWLRDQGDVSWEAGGVVQRLAGACVDVTDLKEAEAALREANEALEARVQARTAELAEVAARRVDLTRRLATTQEDERRRASRDLHDSVGQLLAALSLAFKAIETSGDLLPVTAAKLGEAQRLADAVGKEVHALAVRLRPTTLDDIGLAPALGQLVAEWSGRTEVTADFQAAGLGPDRLPAEVETTIYRLVQEALTNVAKHARATQVSVVLTQSRGRVTAVVEDDGVGFDPEATPKGRLGLLGMRERATLVGGDVEVESSPGGGTVVLAWIPVPAGGAV